MKKMNYNCFAKISLIWLSALMMSSCVEKLNLSASPGIVEIEAISEEAFSISITANVEWKAFVKEDVEWLSIEPEQGSGNGTIYVKAQENAVFAERTVRLVIMGEGVGTDTIRIVQYASLDIAEKIVDKIFRESCLENFDRNPQDGKISVREANNVRNINVRHLGIKTLAGIEYFPKITELNCMDNEIETLDLSKNTDLRTLNCSYNPLGNMDFSKYPKLTDLTINDIGITGIDISKNPALKYLTVSNNDLTSIDVSNNMELSELRCDNTKLTTLDVSKNPNLESLSCGGNDLRKVDVSKNAKLVHLYCSSNNNLSEITDVSQNPALQTLYCSNTKISSLNLRNNANLSYLFCEKTEITTLDLSQNTKLTNFRCNPKLNGSIDISNNKELRYINLQENTSLNTIYVWTDFDDLNRYYEKDAKTGYIKK